MCITESLCCIPETNTILEINYMSTKLKKRNVSFSVDLKAALVVG